MPARARRISWSGGGAGSKRELPSALRLSSRCEKPMRSRRFTTGPTTSVAGGLTCAFSTASSMVARVATTTFSSCQKAIWIMAAGVSGLFPFSMSLAAIFPAFLTPIRKTSVSILARAGQSRWLTSSFAS